MDEFDQLAVARACKTLAFEIACPGSEELSHLNMAREILGGTTFPLKTLLCRALTLSISDGSWKGLTIAGEDTSQIVMSDDRTEGRRRQVLPQIPFCVEKRRLLEVFTESVHDLILLQQQQVAALLQNEPDFSRFDILLHMANEKKDQSKYVYLAHVESHGWLLMAPTAKVCGNIYFRME